MITNQQEPTENSTTCVDEGDSGVVYPEPGWSWQYPQPKILTKNAQAPKLLLVEFFHYTLYATQLGVAYATYYFADFYSHRCASVFLVMMAPVFQALAGTVPMLMHEYEGWQLTIFTPPSEDPTIPRDDYNSEKLREATYKLLFLFQTFAFGMFVIGVFGADKWSIGSLSIQKPWTWALLAAVTVWLYFAPRDPKATFNFLGRPVMPAPKSVLYTFIPITILYLLAMIQFLGLVPALVISVLLIVGPMFEALLAESTFNQFWHLLAVLFLNAGGLLQIYFIVSTALKTTGQ